MYDLEDIKRERDKAKIKEKIREINKRLGYIMYSPSFAGDTINISVNSGPHSIEYTAMQGDFDKCGAFLIGVLSGVNSQIGVEEIKDGTN